MATLKVKQTGQIGVIEDIPSYELPANAWSSVANARFNDGYAQKSLGRSVFVVPITAPHFLLPLQDTIIFYWIYAGLTAIYTTDGTVNTNVTNATRSYGTTNDRNWDGDIFSGTPVINNSIDPPQALFPVSHTNKFIDLPNWPTGYVCGFIKTFGNYLITGDIDKGSGRFPYLIKWSHQADPGTLPSTWDETDTTKDAGEQNLASRGGYVVDGGELGDRFIIYRENATHTMRLIGGRFIFSFLKDFGDSGIFAKRCFVEFDRNHCVLTDDDLIVHDGRNKESILDARNRETLFSALKAATNPTRTYLSHNLKKNEIWVCYPEGTADFATRALIWNYKHNSVGYQTLPGANDIKFDVVQITTTSTISQATGLISAATEIIGTRLYDPSSRDSLIADTKNTQLFKGDDTNQFNGVSFTSTLQRTGVIVDDDITTIKRIKAVYPKIQAIAGTVVNIKIGYHAAPEATVNWSAAKPFIVGTDFKIDLNNDNNSGRLLAWEFETTGDVAWKLHSFDIDYDVVSGR